MADPAAIDPITAAKTDVSLQEKINFLRSKLAQGVQDVTYEGALEDTVFSSDDYKAVVLTAINGGYDLPEQRVAVEYLSNNQKLQIPYGLAMMPNLTVTIEREVPRNDVMASRYLKIASLNYVQVRAFMLNSTSPADIRTAVDALNEVTLASNALFTDWHKEEYYLLTGGEIEATEYAATVFAYVSQALQFNCDIRDVGKLSFTELRLADNDWKDISAVPKSRLNIKFEAYTILNVAALNYNACSRHALPAWVRAYGLATGVLHNRVSKCQREYKFVVSQPTVEDRGHVARYERESPNALYPLSMNIIAMFGVFHLNKDHTFRGDDPNMIRICDSYIETLRTIMYDKRTDELKQIREHICRTAAHPFGLGQTYFVARVMERYSNLASPLAIRLDVTPPPIQRFMIVNAAVDEWTSLPIGRALNQIYESAIRVIKAEVRKIHANPPAYSGLFDLYGEPHWEKPTEEAKAAVEALIPNVYGFAMTLHVSDQNMKDGLALALSLKNIERDRKALATAYENLWSRYLEDMDKEGLIKFAQEAASQMVAPGAAV